MTCTGKGQAHVDHVDGNPNNNDPANLRTMCVGCHSRKTARENGGFGNAAHTVIGCDEDGWPLGRLRATAAHIGGTEVIHSLKAGRGWGDRKV